MKRESQTYNALCWSCVYCTNGALCCWADGIERNDWIVRKERGGITVISCGGYKRDWTDITISRLAKILGVCERSVYKYDTNYIIAKLKNAGYKVRVGYIVRKRKFYLMKIEPPLGKKR